MSSVPRYVGYPNEERVGSYFFSLLIVVDNKAMTTTYSLDIDNRIKVRAYYMWLDGSRLGDIADYYKALEIERLTPFNFVSRYSIPLLDNFNVPGHWLYLNYSGNHIDSNDHRFSNY